MAGVLQVLGIAYIVLMLYLTFLYYKRNNYSTRSFIFWAAIWACGAVLLLLPESMTIFTQRLGIARVTDFYLIAGLMLFSMLCFYNFSVVKSNEAKVEELVRQMALKRKK